MASRGDVETAHFLRSDEEKANGVAASKNHPFMSDRAKSLARVVGGGALLLVVLVSIMRALTPSASSGRRFHLPEPDETSLHVILYGSTPPGSTVDMCKGVLSSSLLHYPPVTFINSTFDRGWEEDVAVADEDEEEPLRWSGKGYNQMRTKIDAIQEALWSIDEHHNNLVMVVDAYDTVLQLRPSVVIDRYRQMVSKTDSRTSSHIIFAANKKCGPQSVTDPWCYLQYGAAPPTPYLNADADFPVFIDDGFLIGPVSELRALLERASEYQNQRYIRPGHSRFRKAKSRLDDRAVFNIIFAEQQLHRELESQREASWYSEISKRVPFLHDRPMTHVVELRRRLGLLPGRQYEFRIGLDYASELIHVQDEVTSAHDAHFIVYGDGRGKKPSVELSACTPRLQKLPIDIGRSIPPFANLDAPLADTKWTGVKLYTNICTGTVPAAILYRDGNSQKNVTSAASTTARQRNWSSLWYHDHVWNLLAGQKWMAAQAKAEVIGGSMIMGPDEGVKDFDPRVDILKGDVNIGDVRSLDDDKMRSIESKILVAPARLPAQLMSVVRPQRRSKFASAQEHSLSRALERPRTLCMNSQALPAFNSRVLGRIE
ncbi:hypothetical protein MRB53_039444 [Persea americana]|nr:hypothetical protein MRB53_039444 [Persea americana]